jgi:hypothetical protein
VKQLSRNRIITSREPRSLRHSPAAAPRHRVRNGWVSFSLSLWRMNPGVYHQAARRLWRRERGWGESIRLGRSDGGGKKKKKGTGPTTQTTSITELLVVFFFFLFLCFFFLFGIWAIYFHFDLCQVPTIRLPATVCVLCHSAPPFRPSSPLSSTLATLFFFLFLDFFFLFVESRTPANSHSRYGLRYSAFHSLLLLFSWSSV